MKKIINLFIMYTVIFTVITFISSIWQLTSGQATDTNAHILIRGLFTLVGVGLFGLFTAIKINNICLKALVQYIISIAFIMLLVWGIGFFGELSKTAYRDAFFNWTGIFIIVAAICIIVDKVKAKKSNNK